MVIQYQASPNGKAKILVVLQSKLDVSATAPAAGSLQDSSRAADLQSTSEF